MERTLHREMEGKVVLVKLKVACSATTVKVGDPSPGFGGVLAVALSLSLIFTAEDYESNNLALVIHKMDLHCSPSDGEIRESK